MRRSKARNTILVLTTSALVLAGCSGGSNGASGTYYGATGNGGDPAIITVDGSTITWGDFGCNNVGEIDMDDSETSIGTLDKNRATVAWTQEGRYYNTDPFTESEDGTVITMSGGTYSKVGTDAADALLTERTESCDAQEQRRKEADAARVEQAEDDAAMRPAFDTTLDSLLAASESGNLTEISSAFPQNGFTMDEFANYIERNFDGPPPGDLFEALVHAPPVAREMVEQFGH